MNTKKIAIILLVICFCLNQLLVFSCPYIYKKPKSYNSCRETINNSDPFYSYNHRYAEILPNPVVYLYGKNTYDDPIFLMVFSSTIPIEWLNGEKSSDLDAVTLKLKIPEQHGYYYKILQISASQILQTVAYSTSSTIDSSVEGTGSAPSIPGKPSGSLTGKLARTFNRSKAYDTIKPIITSSGVGSDTLTLMLRRGEEYPIPNGQIKVYMMVRGIRDESNRIGDIINKHYKGDDENFYENDYNFKQELSCFVYEISNGTYTNLYDFFEKIGVNLNKDQGFQYKKINDFIKSSVTLKYNDRAELTKALLDAELNDPDMKKLIHNLASHSRNPNIFLEKVNQKKYIDVGYKLSKNIIDFINTIPAEKNAKNLGMLISANQKEITLLDNAAKPSNNADSDKSSDDTGIEDFNITNYDLYADAYKLKMLISAYNYAICKTYSISPDFDLDKYVKNDRYCVCEDLFENPKYKDILALNKHIGIYYTNPNSTKAAVFNLELQKDAIELIENIFSKKNEQKDDMDKLLNELDVNNLIPKVSNQRFKSWNKLKSDPYYGRKYHNAITLVDKFHDESLDEMKKESTTNKDLIGLISNENNVDLRFDKTILQNEKNTFLRFEKKYIDRWCPPLISRVAILPVGILLWPLNLRDARKEYHPAKGAIITSKILEGSKFDKEHNTVEEYIKDDNTVLEDMTNRIKNLKEEMEVTKIKPSISQPSTGKS